MMRILVSDPISPAGISRLRAAGEVDVRTGLKPDELKAIIGGYEALAVRSETKVTAEVLAEAKRLRIIGRAGVGVDNIDVKAATERGIVVVNSPQGNTIAAAELTFAMMLGLARKIPQADASMRQGKWERKKFVGTEMYGKTLGVIGMGKIGGEVARRGRAFEMNVIAYDPFATEETAQSYGAVLVTLEEAIRRADFITVHVPLNDKTRGLIGAAEFEIMKEGVRIVNCARGGVVDEVALADAVRSGKVAGAAFDVFTSEPPPADHPLLSLPQVVVTPHLGASTEEAQVNVAVDIAEQIVDVLAGRPARSPVNMPQLPADGLSAARPYMTLAERIGSLHSQFDREVEGRGRPAKSVEVIFHGDFDDLPTGVITRSVLAGILGPMLSDPVNMVNSLVLAQARGLRVTESRTAASDQYAAMISVRVEGPGRDRTICGSVFGKTELRVVHIDGYEVNIVPEGRMILTLHTDKPGMIGKVGTLLGDRGVNVAGMNVGREKVGGRALMVLMVDDPVDEAIMAELRSIPGMETARLVELK